MSADHHGSDGVRDALRSLDGSLDDLRREQGWRAIDRALDARPRAAAPARTWRVPVFALATLAVIIGLVVAPAPGRERAPVAATPAPPPASDPPTTLSAAAGQRTVFVHGGVTLALVGPGAATVRHERDVVHVQVARGLLVADRTDDAPPIAFEAGDNRVTSRDRQFAVRVEPAMVVLGAGAQAQQIVERHAIELGAPPTATPTATTSVITPPAPVPTTTTISSTSPTAPSARPTARSATSATAPAGERRPPALVEVPLDATELYKRAEAALAVEDTDGARDHLQRLLREYPEDRRADAARYDLALLARTAGDHAIARDLLDTIIARGRDANLRAAARTLRASLPDR